MIKSMRILLCAPETDSPYSSVSVEGLKQGLSAALDGAPVHFCRVDPTGQSLLSGIERISADTDDDIFVVPVTPFAGDTQKRLIPSALSQFPKDIHLARDAGLDPAMLRAARVRVEDAISADDHDLKPHESLLLIVGHGSIDADANGNLMKMARMIWEGLGFGWAEVAYMSNAFPSIEQSLTHANRLGFKSIVVLPYVIISDDSIDALGNRIQGLCEGSEDTRVVMADALGAEANVVQTLAARVHEALAGQASSQMNCQLCTYREQVLAIEAQGHHHHDD